MRQAGQAARIRGVSALLKTGGGAIPVLLKK
jgi:hypothetical protein